MVKLTRNELGAAVAARMGAPQAQGVAAVESVLAVLAEAFAAGAAVELRGFGTFKLRERKAFTGRNPRTGAAVAIPAARKVKFAFTGQL